MQQQERRRLLSPLASAAGWVRFWLQYTSLMAGKTNGAGAKGRT
jgi:hypothetical protein